MFRKSVFGLATAGLLLGSTAATAAPLPVRDAAPVLESEELENMGTLGIILGLAIVAGIIAVVIADADEDEAPTSP